MAATNRKGQAMTPATVATVELRRDATPMVLALKGELDLNGVSDVRDPIVHLLADGPTDVLVDMTDVAFIDSSGVALLVELYSHVTSRPGGRLRIEGLTAAAHRLLDICGLLETFGVEDRGLTTGDA
jgi:anti-sigma B factor antagonist